MPRVFTTYFDLNLETLHGKHIPLRESRKNALVAAISDVDIAQNARNDRALLTAQNGYQHNSLVLSRQPGTDRAV